VTITQVSSSKFGIYIATSTYDGLCFTLNNADANEKVLEMWNVQNENGHISEVEGISGTKKSVGLKVHSECENWWWVIRTVQC